MDMVEIRRRLGGISRQRAHQLASREDFPAPFAAPPQGKVWQTEDIEAWIRDHRQEPSSSV